MITRLTLENFYSVRDRLDIDLTVSEHVGDNAERFAPLYPGAMTRTPKVLAVYGPNAAGKSTILRGISFIWHFIEYGFGLRPGMPIFCHRFNDDSHRKGEMKIGCEFGAPSDLTVADGECGHCRYSYDLVLVGGDTDQPTEVKYESLSYWPPSSGRRVRVFEREQNKLLTAARAFHLQGFTRPLSKVLRPNVSLISTLVQLGHEPSIWIRDFASRIYNNILVEKFEMHEGVVAKEYFEDEALLIEMNEQIQRLDFGISKVTVAKSDSGGPEWMDYDATFSHSGLATPLPIERESNGTRQFFTIFPMIARALKFGGMAIIDELDASIHPLLLPEIVGWFYNTARNTNNAQLWFTCQNPYLLQELSKDEVLLCEKDGTGCTTAFGLNSIKSVRRIDNYAKKYLGGAYGGVPHIG
jgi:hypothetical protein